LSGKLSYQELGIAKLSGFREWLALHPIVSGSENASKMIIFAHHHKVLDGVQVWKLLLTVNPLSSYVKLWSDVSDSMFFLLAFLFLLFADYHISALGSVWCNLF